MAAPSALAGRGGGDGGYDHGEGYEDYGQYDGGHGEYDGGHGRFYEHASVSDRGGGCLDNAHANGSCCGTYSCGSYTGGGYGSGGNDGYDGAYDGGYDGVYDGGYAFDAFDDVDAVPTASDEPRRRRRRGSGLKGTTSGGAVHATTHSRGTRARRQHRRHSSSRGATHVASSSLRALQVAVDAAPVKPSVAELAAASIELWSGLDRGVSSAAAAAGPASGTDGGGGSAGKGGGRASGRAAAAEREAASLRVLLLEERKRLKREVRALKQGWERADERAAGFERELIEMRCAHTSLAKEVALADSLTDWWHGRHTASRRDEEAAATALSGAHARVEALTQELQRAQLQGRELENALSLHDAGREHLRRRLAEREAALAEAGRRSEALLAEAEERRSAEMSAHRNRVGQVAERLEHFTDQLRRERFDVAEWSTSVATCDALKRSLDEEVRAAERFSTRRLEAQEEAMAAERQSCAAQVDAVEERLVRAAAARTNLLELFRAAAGEGEARRLQQAAHEVATSKEAVAAAEAATATKDAWVHEQVRALRGAYREDVHALASTVERLRADAMRATVYARTSTRYLREQTSQLKERLGHNALLAAQRATRRTAWDGWRMLVHRSRAERENAAAARAALAEREGMVVDLESKLSEMRGTHARQLRALQEQHAGELAALQAEARDAADTLGRLKTFSAHKLRELAEALEASQREAADARRAAAAAASGGGGGGGGRGADDDADAESALQPGSLGAGWALDTDGGDDGVAERKRRPELRLNMGRLKVVTYERQLEAAAAKIHKLERQLRQAEAARAAEAEARGAAEAARAASGEEAEAQAEAVRRVEALEALLESRAAEAEAERNASAEAAHALTVQYEARVSASDALAEAPRALERAHWRRELIRIRARVATWALQQWAHSRARLCVRAWREFIRCRQVERVQAACRAMALRHEGRQPQARNRTERGAAAAAAAAAAALAIRRATASEAARDLVAPAPPVPATDPSAATDAANRTAVRKAEMTHEMGGEKRGQRSSTAAARRHGTPSRTPPRSAATPNTSSTTVTEAAAVIAHARRGGTPSRAAHATAAGGMEATHPPRKRPPPLPYGSPAAAAAAPPALTAPLVANEGADGRRERIRRLRAGLLASSVGPD